jgi:hypothetical protein
MYRKLHNLVEEVIVQKAEIDQQMPTSADSYDPCTTSSWRKGHNPPNPQGHVFP